MCGDVPESDCSRIYRINAARSISRIPRAVPLRRSTNERTGGLKLLFFVGLTRSYNEDRLNPVIGQRSRGEGRRRNSEEDAVSESRTESAMDFAVNVVEFLTSSLMSSSMNLLMLASLPDRVGQKRSNPMHNSRECQSNGFHSPAACRRRESSAQPDNAQNGIPQPT